MKIPKKDGTGDPKNDGCENWEDIICDKCGKSCRDDAGDNYEYAEIEACWGFNSRKDLAHHTAQICENCYDALGLNPKVEIHLFDDRKAPDPPVVTRLEVRESRNGSGVFAKAKIRQAEIVWDWSADKIWKKAELPEPYPQDDRFLQIGPDAYVGKVEGPKEIDDFFNHSCAPSCLVIGATLYALRNIKPNEELTFDYSVTMKDDPWEMICNCGAINCRKIIREGQGELQK